MNMGLLLSFFFPQSCAFHVALFFVARQLWCFPSLASVSWAITSLFSGLWRSPPWRETLAYRYRGRSCFYRCRSFQLVKGWVIGGIACRNTWDWDFPFFSTVQNKWRHLSPQAHYLSGRSGFCLLSFTSFAAPADFFQFPLFSVKRGQCDSPVIWHVPPQEIKSCTFLASQHQSRAFPRQSKGILFNSTGLEHTIVPLLAATEAGGSFFPHVNVQEFGNNVLLGLELMLAYSCLSSSAGRANECSTHFPLCFGFLVRKRNEKQDS